MYVEAFSAAKDPGFEYRNEDRYAVRSGRFYAVIDGVTDKSGKPLPDESSRGQEAGRLIIQALHELDADDQLFSGSAASLLEHIAETFVTRYRELGELQEATDDPNRRYGAQLALAVPGSAGQLPAWRLLVVGDCGVRVDGVRTLGARQMAEEVLAAWRALVVTDVLERGAPVEEALACGRHYCLEGADQFEPAWEQALPLLAWERLRNRAHSGFGQGLAGLDAGTLAEILSGGVKGAARYRNAAGRLGQACIDGFAVPTEKVVDEVLSFHSQADGVTAVSGRPRSLQDGSPGIASLELFTDGYFGTPPDHATRLADWEAHLAKVEREDPYKIGAYPATKGSSPGAFTDDRTVLIVKPDGGT